MYKLFPVLVDKWLSSGSHMAVNFGLHAISADQNTIIAYSRYMRNTDCCHQGSRLLEKIVAQFVMIYAWVILFFDHKRHMLFVKFNWETLHQCQFFQSQETHDSSINTGIVLGKHLFDYFFLW